MLKIFLTLLAFSYSLLYALEIIGNFEPIDFDEFEIDNVIAKIDTGAVYSALHCTYIKLNDDNSVTFIPLDSNKTITKKIIKSVNIKSSNGQNEKRVLIDSTIKIKLFSYPILFSLTNRSSMKTKVLIGTDFLKNRFLVDVSKQNLKD